MPVPQNNNKQIYDNLIKEHGSVDNYYNSDSFKKLEGWSQAKVKNILTGLATPPPVDNPTGTLPDAPTTPPVAPTPNTTQEQTPAVIPAQWEATPTPNTPAPTPTAPVMPTKTEDTTMVFGQEAMNRNMADPNYLDTRNAKIANEITAGKDFRNLTVGSIRKLVQNDLIKRGADGADPRLSQTVDSIVGQIRQAQPATTMDEFYNTIASWGTIGAVDNPNAVSAMKLYSKVQALTVKTPQQLGDMIVDGWLLIGSKEYNKLIQSGQQDKITKAKQLANFRIKQEAKQHILDGLNANPEISLNEQSWTKKVKNKNTGTTFKWQANYEENISNEIFGDKSMSYVDTFREKVVNNPELLEAKEKGRKTYADIKEKDDLIRNMQDDIKTQIVGSGWVITKWYLAQLTEERLKPLLREREMLTDQYSIQMGIVKDITDMANTEFELELKQYSEDREVALEQYRYDRQLQDTLKMKKMDQTFQTQQNEQQRQKQLTLNQITNQQDIEKLKMQQQFAIWESDKQWNRTLMKEQYDAQTQSRIAQEKWMMENGYLEPSIDENGNINFSLVDQNRSDFGYAPGLDNPDIAKVCLPNGTQWGQCAKYVNDVLQKAGWPRLFSGTDQSINGKIAVTRGEYGSPIPVLWGTVVQDFGIKWSNWTNYGHVGVVIWLANWGKDLIVSDSNYSQDEKVQVRTIKDYQNNATIKWYTINPTAKVSSGNQMNDAILNKLAINFFDEGKFEKSDLAWLGINEKQFKAMARPLYIQTKQQQYSQSGVSVTNPDLLIAWSKEKKQKFDESLSNVTWFEQNLNDLVTYMKNQDNSWVELAGRASDDWRYIKSKREGLILQLKELNNLGVLNGQDYEILSKTLPDATGFFAYWKALIGSEGRDWLLKQYDTLLKDFTHRINAKASQLWLEYKPGSSQNNIHNQSSPTPNLGNINSWSVVSNYGFQMPQTRQNPVKY